MAELVRSFVEVSRNVSKIGRILSLSLCAVVLGCDSVTEPRPVGVNARVSVARIRSGSTGSPTILDTVAIEVQTLSDPDELRLSYLTAEHVRIDSIELPPTVQDERVFYRKSSPPDNLGLIFKGDIHTVSVGKAADYPGFIDSVRLPEEPVMISPLEGSNVGKTEDLRVSWMQGPAGAQVAVSVVDLNQSAPLLETEWMPDSGAFVVPAHVLASIEDSAMIQVTKRIYTRRSLTGYHSYSIEVTATRIVGVKVM